MESTKHSDLQSTFSRRNLLKGAAALTAAASVPAFGQQPTGAPSGTVWLYIGTYTGNEASIYGRGKGIYLCELNLSSGRLSVLRLVAEGVAGSTASPSSIDLNPAHTRLYVGNEFGPPGGVSAYSINRQTGDLTLLNVQAAAGAPAHVSVDHEGRYLFAAEYSGSWFEAFPILPNGTLGPAAFQMQTLGNVDTSFTMKAATSAPPGSFARSAHEGPNGHPHQMEADPSNGWVLGSDAGQDRIYVWKFNSRSTSPLTPAAVPFVKTPGGDGPRHFAFHPNGRWLYSIQEEGSTIMLWRFDRVTGALSPEQTISSLPPGFVGTNFTSEIRVSADGDFVYGVNRLSDTIGVFKVGNGGRLTPVSFTSTLGDYPRIIIIDPTGRYLVSGNQAADHVTTFKIQGGHDNGNDDQGHQGKGEGGQGGGGGKGSLKFTGDYTAVPSASGMVFLT